MKVVREALGTQVANHIRDAIVRGDLEAGERLVETEFADSLNVSRGPVRDGFRILEAEGLIAKRGQGYLVQSLDERDIRELYSLRSALESLATSMTMALEKTPDLGAMRAVVEAMGKAADAGDSDEFARVDVIFHSMLCDLSGHRRLAAVWRQYEPITMALLRVTVLVDDDLHVTTARHALLIDLIEGGDSAAVLAELEDHLDGSRERMLEAWRTSAARQTTP
ncbi:GntR family transcriptional regulator [Microbacterium sp. A93]|uniref:GntR family transcriptional regulator n=1 Tax=Microbacterium sp. A93 TaxID=3450716 RepID=UPI003F431374